MPAQRTPNASPAPAPSLRRWPRQIDPRGYLCVGAYFAGLGGEAVWVLVAKQTIQVSLDPIAGASRVRLGRGHYPRLYLVGALADPARRWGWRCDWIVTVTTRWADTRRRTVVIAHRED